MVKYFHMVLVEVDQTGTQSISNVLKQVLTFLLCCKFLINSKEYCWKISLGEDFPEVLEKIKFSSISWTHDHKGVFYSCYPEQQGKTDGSETTSNENHKLFYHRIGTQQSEDILVVEFTHEPKWRM